jgi:uncharacterized SAM-binding protein YcdF (DUF218 family)
VSDIFREVDEEVRREKLQQLWDRHSNLIVAAALLVVLAVGGWRGYDWWEHKKAAEAGQAFEAAVLLAEGGKQAEAQAAFAKVAQEGSSGYRTLARFREAAELAKTDPAAAVNAYAVLAADSSLGITLQAVSPHGARNSGTRRLARRRCPRGKALVRFDCHRCRDARRNAAAHGRADDALWRQSENVRRDVTEPAMRSRLFTAAALLLAFALAGCESFDPLDKLADLDIMGTSKKPLVGERRSVFATGVPGVPQGVPPEMVKGYQAPAEAPPPVVEAKPVKPKPKKTAAVPRKPRPQPQQQTQQMQQAPAAQGRTSTEQVGQSAGQMQPMPGAQPTWPTNAPPAPGPWAGPQR